MFRLRNLSTDLWYNIMDKDGDIIWTSNKAQAQVFPPDKRWFWEVEYEGELEIVPLEEDEVMTLRGMERLPGF